MDFPKVHRCPLRRPTRPTRPTCPTTQRVRRGGTPEGYSVFSPGVEEGRKPRRRPRDRSAWRNPPPTPPGCRTYQLGNQCDTLSGSYTLYAPSYPGSSALRASTPGLKAGDPSGASPLRDRQAGASPVGDAPRQGCLLRSYKRPLQNGLSPKSTAFSAGALQNTSDAKN